MFTDLPIRHRRTHSTEFKTHLVSLCQPGVSVSSVALAHELNANLLRRWIKQYPAHAPMQIVQSTTKLVPVRFESAAADQVSGNIQMDIQHGKTHISIRWPTSDASTCVQWLGAWLK
jgi:transposase-like protein